MALYVANIVSLCFPHVVDVSALVYVSAFSICASVCCCNLYVVCVCEFVSRASPSIFGLMFCGSMMLSICSAICVLYPAGAVLCCITDLS